MGEAARAGRGAGVAFWQVGRVQESFDAFRDALALARESSDRLLESNIRSDLGTAASWLADPHAEEYCQTALALARQLRAPRETAKALNCLGEAAYFAQAFDESLALHLESERLFDHLGDRRGLAQSLMLQGYVHSDLSRFERAQDCYQRAQLLWESLGDPREQAITLVARARLRMRRGEYQEALNDFNEALVRLEPMGNAAWEGAILTGLARVHLDMGNVEASLRYWERSFAGFETAGLKAVAIDILMSLGLTYLASGDDVRGLDRFELALDRATTLGHDRFRALALRHIGAVYLSRRDTDDADQSLQRSLELQRTLDDRRLAAVTRTDLAEVHLLRGEHAVALRYLDEALTLSRAAEDRVGEARVRFGLARASLGLRNLSGARQHVEQALAVVESLRTAVEDRELRASYFASVHEYHEVHLDVLMRLHGLRPGRGLAAAAFEAAERARARSLLESLAQAAVDLRAGVDAKLLKRERAAREAFDDWARRRRRLEGDAADKAQAAATTEEYRDLEERYAQIQAEIRSRSPRYAALVQPHPLTLVEVQRQVLDAETLLLEYALGDQHSYVWAVTSEGYSAHALPPRKEIEDAALRVHGLLTARLAADGDSRERAARLRQADTEYWDAARQLSETLLGPVAKQLAGKRILVVADGALQYLPFAALPVPGAGEAAVPLMVEHEIVSLPSASVLAVLRRETARRALPTRAVAVLADPVFEADDPRLAHAGTQGQLRPATRDGTGRAPDATRPDRASLRAGSWNLPRLASTGREAEAIVALAPTGQASRRSGFDASRAAAMSADLAHYRIVHFATHGVFDNEYPGLSGVALSMFDARGQALDGFLRLRDIYALSLPVELVVLSACDTALGKPVRGEGLAGLVRGFMHAGTKRVVASLWKVDDEATAALMTRFYREMLRQGRSPAAALRQAQRSMWEQERWRPPYYWAAFVLQGEWQ